jgi:hypothetical protein
MKSQENQSLEDFSWTLDKSMNRNTTLEKKKQLIYNAAYHR